MQTTDLILKQFPGTAMIPMVIAGHCIGLANQTCYNLFHKKAFPLPVRKVGRKSMVALTDLIKFIDNGCQVSHVEQSKVQEIPKKRPGRPTKAEVRRRREA